LTGVISSARNIFPIGISTGENLRVQVLRGRFFSKDEVQIVDYSVFLFLMRVMFMISCSGVSLAAKFMLKFLCMCGSEYFLFVAATLIFVLIFCYETARVWLKGNL